MSHLAENVCHFQFFRNQALALEYRKKRARLYMHSLIFLLVDCIVETNIETRGNPNWWGFYYNS